jgi:hypothetical protein
MCLGFVVGTAPRKEKGAMNDDIKEYVTKHISKVHIFILFVIYSCTCY